MKHLKSTHGDLQRLFTQTITIREIAEPLATFDINHQCDDVGKLMEERDFDVVGVLNGGKVCGYVRREGLGLGVLRNFFVPFKESEIMDEAEPLLEGLKALQDRSYLFVRFLGSPCGIITRGDLQKAPIRLWLFGLITLLEMQMLRCIRLAHTNDSWKLLLSGESIASAEEKLRRLRMRNEATDLIDCLTLDDKSRIFKKSPQLLNLTGCQNGTHWWKFACSLRDLRNDLAHSGDFIYTNWSVVAADVDQLENVLQRLEKSNVQMTA